MKKTASLTSRVRARPSAPLPSPPGGLLRGHRHAGAVDRGVQLVRQRERRQRHQFPGGDERCPVPDGGSRRGAAALGCSFDALDRQPHPSRTSSSRAAFANGPAAAASSFIARSPGDMDAPATPSPASRGANPCPQAAQWYPRAESDRPERRVDDLVPVGDELSGMPLAAWHPRTPVAGIRGQQLLQHAAARLQHPGADDGLRSLQPGATTAQRPGCLRCQAAYLGGLLPRERIEEPPFSPSGTEGAASRRQRPGLADLLVHLRDPFADRRELRMPGDLPPHLGHLPGGQLPANGAASPGGPGPQEPRPVARMTRLRARAVRLPARPVVLAHRPAPEITNRAELRVQPFPLGLQLRERRRPACSTSPTTSRRSASRR